MRPLLFYYGIMDELKELWPGGLRYAGDSPGTDSLALADFAGRVRARRGVELGCGSGLVLLLLAHGSPALEMTGVELRPYAAEECRNNLRANGMERRCHVITGDFRAACLAMEKADLVVANPPYFPAGSGGVSPDEDRALMRTETADLGELFRCAASLLEPGGAFCLVHRTKRMSEIFAAGAAVGLEPKRLRMIAAAPGRAPKLFLLELRRGGAPGLVTEPTLFQHTPLGTETEEYRRICHMERQK